SVSFDACVWANAARQRTILTFDREHPGALTEDEPVAAAIEGTRCRLGTVVVVGRHRTHARETENHTRQHAAIRPASEQQVVRPRAYQRSRVANRIGGAGAAA